MIAIDELKKEFAKHGGVMKTSQLNAIGLDSRRISRLKKENVLFNLKRGIYMLNGSHIPDEIILSKLFPTAIIYLESALFHYGYTDRIPPSWQIAVDKDISKSQFKIAYPPVTPFYLESKFIDIGVDTFDVNGVKVKIYDKERTICDVLRYTNKINIEVFKNAIHRYLKDKDKNIKRLIEYAKKLRVLQKLQTYVGVWL